MKHLLTAICLLFIAGCTTTVVEEPKFIEGQDYNVLTTEKSSDLVVSQYFSFYCPHCAQLEPLVLELKDHLRGEAKYQKNHVLFMGGPMGEPMAKAHATMVELGDEDRLVSLMFNRVHKQATAPRNLEQLRDFFTSNGVSGDDFDRIFNSVEVDETVTSYYRSFRATHLSGVPAIVVNNKYVVDLSSFTEYDESYRNELIDYLLTL